MKGIDPGQYPGVNTLHAFTGSDYCIISRQRKIKSEEVNILMMPVPDAADVVTIKKFTCELLCQTETGKWCQICKIQAEIGTKQKSLEQN